MFSHLSHWHFYIISHIGNFFNKNVSTFYDILLQVRINYFLLVNIVFFIILCYNKLYYNKKGGTAKCTIPKDSLSSEPRYLRKTSIFLRGLNIRPKPLTMASQESLSLTNRNSLATLSSMWQAFLASRWLESHINTPCSPISPF